MIAILVAVIAVGTFALLHRDRNVESVEIKTDTLRYEKVTPLSIEVEEGGVDSIYTFRDTLQERWSAEVSGSNVELRSLVLLDRVERQNYYTNPEWEVALKTGLSPGSLWVGVGVSRSVGRFTFSLDGGYDGWRDSPYVGGSASFKLWEE
ncbi:MAG: hypothetical protein SNF68_03435 [Rikenellaceae bacterium]